MAGRRAEPWAECRVGGRRVLLVEFGAHPPTVTLTRAEHLTPAQREQVAHWMLGQFRDHDPECRLGHDDCYAILFGPWEAPSCEP